METEPELQPLQPPGTLTMDRIGEKNELVLAQSTSQCCRCCCFQPSINWVLENSDNFQPGTNPFDLEIGGWIHEESSWCHRWWTALMPACRKIKYVHHSGKAPESITQENKGWFRCQTGPITKGMSEEERNRDVIATHEKEQTCGICCLIFPLCFNLPYLETKGPAGEKMGTTEYLCDMCPFVPKFQVRDKDDQVKYLLRPDTCVAGACVMCRCGGGKGKCFRVPFIVRDPVTKEPLKANVQEGKAELTNLWSGWANECCMRKNAYYMAFPEGATTEDKLTLIGSTVLIDVVMFEQEDDNDS